MTEKFQSPNGFASFVIHSAYALSIIFLFYSFVGLTEVGLVIHPWILITLLILNLSYTIFFFLNKNILIKNNLKYIIITEFLYIITLLVFFILGNVFFNDDPRYPWVISLCIVTSILIWVFCRLLGGWIAFSRKEPLEGHFGIRLRKA